MCDNCTCKEDQVPSYEALTVSVEQQRRIIDQLEADAGKQQEKIAKLETENAAYRTTMMRTNERIQTMIANAEAELKRREESILYMSEAGAA